MEPVQKLSGKVKGLEVLHFEDAEIQKIKNGLPSYAATGQLSVLYFKDFDRFFLRLNDWTYPLMRRMPLLGLDKSSVHCRRYSLPGPNGSVFNLAIDSCGSDQGFENLDAILQDCSKFSWKGQPHTGKLDQSPDDKLTRHLKKETGFKEMISESFKHSLQSIKNKIGTIKQGTKNMNSRKKMIDIKTIKNKNFRKEAKTTFSKDFFESGEKLSREFMKARSENLNLTLPKSYKELLSDSQAPALYFWKEELEEAILNYRDIASKGGFDLEKTAGQRTELTEAIRGGMKEMKEGLAGRRDNLTQDRTRERNPNVGGVNPGQVLADVNTHYQG